MNTTMRTMEIQIKQSHDQVSAIPFVRSLRQFIYLSLSVILHDHDLFFC